PDVSFFFLAGAGIRDFHVTGVQTCALPISMAVQLVVTAIERAGYVPGDDKVFALYPAATELFENGGYELRGEGRRLSPDEMVDYWERWVSTYPIVSIEDGLAEDEWESWKTLTERIGHTTQLVGDDL